MDHLLTREESIRLMQLLELPMDEFGNFNAMRSQFHKQIKKMHPDKGGNPEQAKELISLYKKLEEKISPLQPDSDATTTEQVPPYGTPEWEQWWRDFNDDLFCDEQFDRDEEENLDATPQCSQESKKDDLGDSQATPPKKKRKTSNPTDMPEDLIGFLSQAILSNKTLSAFLVYTTQEKSVLIYKKIIEKFKTTFCSRHTDLKQPTVGFVYCITSSRHRVSAILNFCSQLCSISFCLVKGIIKCYECYIHLCVEPYVKVQETLPGGLARDFFDTPEEAQKNVSWKLITEYAMENAIDDIFLLMGLYKEFIEETEDCVKCREKVQPCHFKYHSSHRENALLFVDCRNQKTICQQAVDNVTAAKRVESTQLTREQLLAKRFKHLFSRMESLFGARSAVTLELYLAGAAWFECLFGEEDFLKIILDFLACMVDNIPKKRYWLFTGSVNTGKTTLAACLLDLCGGKSLNVNMPFDKLNFELGVGIDQFMVVFEDVKGQQTEHKHLPTGQGINNLDNLRDYLDGAVKVNLEKKHLNKRSQIFPPGIITANQYTFPLTLRARLCRTLRFQYSSNLFLSLKRTEALSKYRVLQNGVCLLAYLLFKCDIDDFSKEITEEVKYWKQRVEEEVPITKFLDFKKNCKNGKNLLSQEDSSQAATEDLDTEDFTS
nr:large T antigen [Bat polyomavirus 6d]